jgi:hypothetical protein
MIMSKKTVAEPTTRINVALPDKLLRDLRELVPPRQRNQLIVDLLERELRHRRFLKAWDEAAGAWSDEDHPDLMTREDIDRFVRRIRDTAMPRSWDEILAESETGTDERDAQLSTRHEHRNPAIAQ